MTMINVDYDDDNFDDYRGRWKQYICNKMKVYYYFAPWPRLATDMIISSTPIAGLRLYRVIEVDPNDLI